nr:MAG TPA: hypothetical protein [Caudoviricetes sp.]
MSASEREQLSTLVTLVRYTSALEVNKRTHALSEYEKYRRRCYCELP